MTSTQIGEALQKKRFAQAEEQSHRRFLRPQGAARYLGIGISSFWRLAKEDSAFPPLIKLAGRTTVVEISALDAWADRKAAVVEA